MIDENINFPFWEVVLKKMGEDVKNSWASKTDRLTRLNDSAWNRRRNLQGKTKEGLHHALASQILQEVKQAITKDNPLFHPPTGIQ